MNIQIKRAYDEPSSSDGHRVLVDRLWPRGVTKEKLKSSEWYRDVAPSTELRNWFGHDPVKWEGFQAKYLTELKKSNIPAQILADAKGQSTLTLLYGAKDTEHNQAVVLKNYLETLH